MIYKIFCSNAAKVLSIAKLDIPPATLSPFPHPVLALQANYGCTLLLKTTHKIKTTFIFVMKSEKIRARNEKLCLPSFGFVRFHSRLNVVAVMSVGQQNI